MKQLTKFVTRVQAECNQCGKQTTCIVDNITWEDNRTTNDSAYCEACYKADKLFDSFIEGVYESDNIRIGNVVKAIQDLSTEELTSFINRVGSRIET